MGKAVRNKSKAARSKNENIAVKIISILAERSGAGMNYKQISKAAGVSSLDDREMIRVLLDRLVRDGILLSVNRGKYILDPSKYEQYAPPSTWVTGTIDMKQGGQAYLIRKGEENDIYIAPGHTGRALHGDKVKVQLLPKRKSGRQEGKVTEVLTRAQSEYAGVLILRKNFSTLVPSNPHLNAGILIPSDKLNKARNGDKVLVRLTGWSDDGRKIFAEVSKVLGRPGENAAEMNSILVEFGFPSGFPSSVEQEAERIPRTISEEETAKRKDFRNVFTITIDPEDAKDFDDALSIRKTADDCWEVGVHIADVSHYVPEGSTIDEEAYSRGTSVYLADRVIPMLPEVLSNGLCSLRADEDKLCFSAVFKLSDNAKILEEWFGKTVIRSDRRFNYDEVQEIIEGKNSPFSEQIHRLNSLAIKLREERFRAGSIAFDTEEVRFRLDEQGRPLEIYIRQQKDSNRLIEDFMLLANRRVAEHVAGMKENGGRKTFVYRVHDKPNPEKLQAFTDFIKKFGHHINTRSGKTLADSMNALFGKIKGKSEETLVNMLAVRTMARAEYTTANIGHYGLGFEFYTHFTSPIRRYPDLMVHRLLQRYLAGKTSVRESETEERCQHCSEMERKAVEAERASVKYKQAEFLADKVGGIFEGVVSGVSKWGIYVEIRENKCEGMVSLKDMTDDIYYIDEGNFEVTTQYSGKKIRLGDSIKIKVKSINLQKKQIDFLLV